jgi:hypothetical protein
MPGAVELDDWVPCPTAYGTIVWKSAGTVTTGTIKDIYVPQRPLLVKDVQLAIGTAPTDADLIVDINQYDGSSWTSMFSTEPQIDATDSYGEEQPDGTYQYRCIAPATGDTIDDAAIGWDVDQVGSTEAGQDLVVMVRAMTYSRPQEPLLQYNDWGE